MKDKFDVSWKFIVLAIIVLSFVLSGIDMIVHGAEIPVSNEISRIEKFQAIEDRQLKILAEEDEDFYGKDWITVKYASSNPKDETTTYYYVAYDGLNDDTFEGHISLPDEVVDHVYELSNRLSTDSIWWNAVERYLTFMEI